ncbi:MAG: NACHT domain-containing protein [Hamadaea sp.]|nr:NACHT domain-containing protein [Hamadaea sp.]
MIDTTLRLKLIRAGASAVAFLFTLGLVYAAAKSWLQPLIAWSSARVPLDIGKDLIGQVRDAGAIGLSLAAGTMAARAAWRWAGRLLVALHPASDFGLAVIHQAMEELAEAVSVRLDHETARWDLWRAPLVVTVRSTERAVQADARGVLPGSAEARLRLRADSDSVAELLTGLPHGHLVILGEPGAGKTIMAMRVALDLLVDRAPTEPVPVYFPMAAWNPAVRLDHWITGRIAQDFPGLAKRYGTRLVQHLVETGRILPVLDGLDEATGKATHEIIKNIDRSFTARMRFVLTSRTAEFEEAVRESQQYLSRAAVLEIDPVEATSAAEYLTRTVGDTRRWQPLIDELIAEPDGPVADALRTPLMLFLVRSTYEDTQTDPAELIDHTRFESTGAIEGHLLDSFVTAAYDSGERQRYRERKARRWLATLAHGGREIRWWGFASRTPVAWMAILLAFWGSLVTYMALGPILAVLYGGLACWALVKAREFLSDLYAEVLTDDLRTGVRSHLRRYRLLSTVITLAVAVGVGSLVGLWLVSGVRLAPDRARGFALAVGLLFGLTTFFDSVWGSYFLSRLYLGVTGRLPLRLIRFLEDAHRRGVLRQPSGAYQFRHARLQDWLRWNTRVRLPDGGWHPVNAPASRVRLLARLLRAPMLSLAAQLIVVLVATLPALVVDVDQLRFRAGTRPKVVDESLCNPQGGGCLDRVRWHWSLPPGSTETTEFYAQDGSFLMRYAYNGLTEDGVKIAGCPAARIEISAGDGRNEVYGTAVVDATKDFAFGEWASGRRFDTVSITFRRLDSAPCTADLVWTNPSLKIDKKAQIREFLS